MPEDPEETETPEANPAANPEATGPYAHLSPKPAPDTSTGEERDFKYDPDWRDPKLNY